MSSWPGAVGGAALRKQSEPPPTIATNTPIDDYFADIASKLALSPVYVHPEANVPADTSGKLRSLLTKNDRISLALLPGEVVEYLAMSPYEIVSRLSEELNHDRILGLAVGTEVVGYARILPDGLADEQMARAAQISNRNPVNALTAYVNYIHKWVAEHNHVLVTPTPEPTSTPIPTPTPQPKDTPSEDGVGLGTWLFGGLSTIGLLLGGAIYFRNRQKPNYRLQIEGHLEKLRQLIPDIRDYELQSLLRAIDHDAKASLISSGRQLDPGLLASNLGALTRIMNGYIQVQNNPSGYDKPQELLAQWKSGAERLHGTLDISIKQINAEKIRQLNSDLIEIKAANEAIDPDAAFKALDEA